MNRRSFIVTLCGGLAASAAGVSLASAPVAAASLAPENAARLDAAPAEFSQYWRRPRRRRTVCSVRRNRYGRRVRVCRTVYY
ncbi:hypothetical protein ACFPOB_19725 [Bosea eneae]|jgi:hypothetical protein|uniref:Protamine-2 (Modular protein) n=1 Tax=Bosea eneae TaxID=151454 RepID=A0ABW0IX74_9HYPH